MIKHMGCSHPLWTHIISSSRDVINYHPTNISLPNRTTHGKCVLHEAHAKSVFLLGGKFGADVLRGGTPQHVVVCPSEICVWLWLVIWDDIIDLEQPTRLSRRQVIKQIGRVLLVALYWEITTSRRLLEQNCLFVECYHIILVCDSLLRDLYDSPQDSSPQSLAILHSTASHRIISELFCRLFEGAMKHFFRFGVEQVHAKNHATLFFYIWPLNCFYSSRSCIILVVLVGVAN